ncbi:MAG: hypothetical protein JW818_22710 [Pirellulales bacterium]|nr:hypothetical protein [Pirellulales bacterium]
MTKPMSLIALVAVLAIVIGCAPKTENSASGPKVDGAKYLLAKAPDGAAEVIEVFKSAKDGDDVVIVGRIGGSKNPWIESRAAFSLVDCSLKACTDISGDNCPTPWDYCCVTDQMPGATALVKIVDDQGKPLPVGAKQLLGVEELSTVVVKGKAKRDDAGNLTVLAEGVHLKKK